MRKVKPETYKEMGMEISSPKAAIYPSVSFDGKTLPEAKDWKVGKIYEISLNIKMTGTSQRKSRDGVERANFDFDIVGIDSEGEVKGKVGRYSEDKDD